jgi:hypothetical protein
MLTGVSIPRKEKEYQMLIQRYVLVLILKVMEPFVPIPGRPPRKVVIDR